MTDSTDRFAGKRPILPARYNPRSGKLHRSPCSEQCNLDASDADIEVKTLDELRALPPNATFCVPGDWSAEDIILVAEQWDMGRERTDDA